LKGRDTTSVKYMTGMFVSAISLLCFIYNTIFDYSSITISK